LKRIGSRIFVYILNNIDEIIPYIEQYIDEIKAAHPWMNKKWIFNEHNKSFLVWFKKRVCSEPNALKILLRLV